MKIEQEDFDRLVEELDIAKESIESAMLSLENLNQNNEK